MWTYKQSTGYLVNHDNTVSYKCYAGAPGYVNKPEFEREKGKGVIPKGFYTIQPPRDSKRTGRAVHDLIPDPTNEMYGRSAFQIHGDSVRNPGTASNGCIILNQPYRGAVWKSGDHKLQVIE